jgi:hypothetical protein
VNLLLRQTFGFGLALEFRILYRLVQFSRLANSEYAVIERLQINLSAYCFVSSIHFASAYPVSGNTLKRSIFSKSLKLACNYEAGEQETFLALR